MDFASSRVAQPVQLELRAKRQHACTLGLEHRDVLGQPVSTYCKVCLELPSVQQLGRRKATSRATKP